MSKPGEFEKSVLQTSDGEIVGAIRSGERERYSELVERHASAVFGIAWSRLGDHALAEEAAQETFVQAYRRLNLLKNMEAFGGWVAAIARNVAINLGIRHRREMQKRERWKVEQPVEVDEGEPEQEEFQAATLQETLRELPPIHRETLILYYIEGKSIEEAAAASGVSETAFKTRLHRAREYTRAALEKRLEGSLEKLRPSPGFAAGVMLALPAHPAGAGLAGGKSSGILGGLAKVVPAGWIFFWLQFISIIPGLFYARWLLKKDRENFRDQESLRARNADEMRRRATWFVPFMMMAIIFGVRSLEKETTFLILLVTLVIPAAIWGFRRLILVVNRQTVAEALVALMLIPLCIWMQLDWPEHYIFYFNGALLAALSITMVNRPTRMDYSLFLRTAGKEVTRPSEGSDSRVWSRTELFRFAQFLAERGLVWDWRWKAEGLELKLAPVTPRAYFMWVPLMWRGWSTVSISFKGAVRAEMGRFAQKDLERLKVGESREALEGRVTRSVEKSMAAFGRGKIAEAEDLIWEEPDERIFHQLPKRSVTTRALVWSFRGFAILSLGMGLHLGRTYWAGEKQGLEMVRYSDEEFRTALEGAMLRTRGTNIYFDLPYRSVKLPERRFFTAAAIETLHNLILQGMSRYSSSNAAQRSTDYFLGDELFHRAFDSGLITTNEFAKFGIDLAAIRAEIQSWPARRKRMQLGSRVGRKNSREQILNTREINLRTALLAGTGLLEEFETEELVAAIVAR